MKKNKLLLTLTAVASTTTIVTPIAILATSCSCSTDASKFVLIRTSEGYCIDGLLEPCRENITEINVPSSIDNIPVVEISKGAFKGCINLQTITLPFIGHTANAKGTAGLFGYIFGDEMYEGCGGYTWQEYSYSDQYDETDVEYAQFAIPSSLRTINIKGGEYIPAGAFSNCKYIRSINIENNKATEIENYAFYGCMALKEFNISNKITTIGRKAFQACYNIKEINLPTSVTTIKHNAFSNCITASSASIPQQVTSMGKQVFENFVSGLIMVEAETEPAGWDPDWVSNTTSVVYGYSSGGVYTTDKVMVALCGKQGAGKRYGFIISWIGDWDETNVIIPSSFMANGIYYPIEKIGPNMFSGNDVVKTLTIPDSITAISANAFEDCVNLEGVKFGTGLTTIGPKAFIGCSKLYGHLEGSEESPTVVAGLQFNNVQTIHDSAFKADESIVSVDFGSKLETIGASAFEDCHGLSPLRTQKMEGETAIITPHPLVFPATLTSIGDYAFKNCCRIKTPNPTTEEFTYTNDADVEFTKGTQAVEFGESSFENFGVRQVVAPYNDVIRVHMNFNDIQVNEFKTATFKNAYLYGMYNFPTSVQSFGDYSFYYTYTAYTNKENTQRLFVIPKTTKSIGKYAFYYNNQMAIKFEGDPTDPSYEQNWKLTSIGAYAFQNCAFAGKGEAAATTIVKIPNTVETLGAAAFAGCTQLRKVTLPTNEKFTRLEGSTFSSCTNLGIDQTSFADALIVPETVTYIGSSAFANCKYLQYIHVKGDITTIGSSAFANCKSLANKAGNTNLKFDDNLINVTSFGTSVYSGCETMEWAPFPNNGNDKITSIPASSFTDCSKISDFEVLGSIASIGASAFKNCTAMTKVTGMGAVKYIYENAFYGCSNLTQVEVPSSCHTIAASAFANCTNLGKTIKFVLPTDITQAWSTSSKKGMGTTPFIGWTADQTIYFKQANIDHYDGDNIVTRWGWTLVKDTATTKNFYTCKESGSSTVHFKLDV